MIPTERTKPNDIEIKGGRIVARGCPRGYVSGVASLLDKATGAMIWGSGWTSWISCWNPPPIRRTSPRDSIPFGPNNAFHGNIPKRYVEGPQICTQAKPLPVQVINGEGFTAVRQLTDGTWRIRRTTGPARSGNKR